MKVHIEKDIYIPSGIYCTQCSRKETNIQGNAYCDEFGDWLHASNDGTNRIVKCISCFKAMQRQITGKRY